MTAREALNLIIEAAKRENEAWDNDPDHYEPGEALAHLLGTIDECGKSVVPDYVENWDNKIKEIA